MTVHFPNGFGNPLAEVPETTTQLFALVLNPMQDRAEAQSLIAFSESKEELTTLLRDELVEPYKDENWRKTYRKGGPLEWFNPPYGHEEGKADMYGCGIIELKRDSWRRVA